MIGKIEQIESIVSLKNYNITILQMRKKYEYNGWKFFDKIRMVEF